MLVERKRRWKLTGYSTMDGLFELDVRLDSSHVIAAAAHARGDLPYALPFRPESADAALDGSHPVNVCRPGMIPLQLQFLNQIDHGGDAANRSRPLPKRHGYLRQRGTAVELAHDDSFNRP